jgi:hypothetical protein
MSNNVQRNKTAHTAKKRPERIPLGQGSKLSVADQYIRDGFHCHLFLDNPGELESAERAYYEFVKDDQGEKVSMPAGNGRTHFLMEISNEYYNQDMANQQKMVTDTTRQNIAINKRAGEYSPEGHKTSVTRDI